MPSPWHTGHVEIFLPVPWQRGHCTLNFMRPPVCVIWPLPLHCGHLPGASSVPVPMAIAAGVAARNIQPHHAAADRRPERNIDLIFEIGAGLRAFFGCSGTAASAEDVRKRCRGSRRRRSGRSLSSPAAFEQIGEIEAAEVEWTRPVRRLPPEPSGGNRRQSPPPGAPRARISFRRRRIDVVRVEPKLVVNLAFLGIAEDVVGFGDCLELFLGDLSPGFTSG